MTDVEGDPASCASAAAALARLATGLRGDIRRVTASYADAGRGWSGPASVGARRRGDALVTGAEQVARTVEDGAVALREHTVALAGLADRWRRLRERATASGFVLDESGPSPAPGIRGEAHAGAEARLAADEAVLRAEWVALLAESTLAGARLRLALDVARVALATSAATLRSL